jgi:predicted DNA-binding ribbon-helix-helix protein
MLISCEFSLKSISKNGLFCTLPCEFRFQSTKNAWLIFALFPPKFCQFLKWIESGTRKILARRFLSWVLAHAIGFSINLRPNHLVAERSRCKTLRQTSALRVCCGALLTQRAKNSLKTALFRMETPSICRLSVDQKSRPLSEKRVDHFPFLVALSHFRQIWTLPTTFNRLFTSLNRRIPRPKILTSRRLFSLVAKACENSSTIVDSSFRTLSEFGPRQTKFLNLQRTVTPEGPFVTTRGAYLPSEAATLRQKMTC